MLFNEPKLLKLSEVAVLRVEQSGFSALQRAEIAEIRRRSLATAQTMSGFSALQRAEIAEIHIRAVDPETDSGFSALQRAEIAEISRSAGARLRAKRVFQCSSTSRNC